MLAAASNGSCQCSPRPPTRTVPNPTAGHPGTCRSKSPTKTHIFGAWESLEEDLKRKSCQSKGFPSMSRFSVASNEGSGSGPGLQNNYLTAHQPPIIWEEIIVPLTRGLWWSEKGEASGLLARILKRDPRTRCSDGCGIEARYASCPQAKDPPPTPAPKS